MDSEASLDLLQGLGLYVLDQVAQLGDRTPLLVFSSASTSLKASTSSMALTMAIAPYTVGGCSAEAAGTPASRAWVLLVWIPLFHWLVCHLAFSQRRSHSLFFFPINDFKITKVYSIQQICNLFFSPWSWKSCSSRISHEDFQIQG